jgi:hypothetical protein
MQARRDKHRAAGRNQQQPWRRSAMPHGWIGCYSHSHPLNLALIVWEIQEPRTLVEQDFYI